MSHTEIRAAEKEMDDDAESIITGERYGYIGRAMNAKWTAFAIGFMCVFAYAAALIVYQLGLLFTGVFTIWTVAAIALLACMICLLVRRNPEDTLAVKTGRKGRKESSL